MQEPLVHHKSTQKFDVQNFTLENHFNISTEHPGVTLMDYFKENILVMGLAAGEEVKECPIVHAIQTTTLVSLETAASKRMRVSKT